MANYLWQRLPVAAIQTTLATVTLAAPFNSFNPRSMGMGGVGVAVSNRNTASLFNTSLLATEHAEDNVIVTLLAVGARAYDQDEFVDAVDDFQHGDYVDNLDVSIAAAEAVPTNPDAYRAVAGR
ncbi:MAG: hypothetical protein ABFS39_12290 [Pseudomonadota bacterium]